MSHHRKLLHLALAVSFSTSQAQHYCWPCAVLHGVIGKYTSAAVEPVVIYDWLFKYLNPANEDDGTHNFYSIKLGQEMKESWDVAPNTLAAEVNECGTFIGNYEFNISNPMTPHEQELVAEGLRLPSGNLHECRCALQGRSHIVNSTTKNTTNWQAMEDAWGAAFTASAKEKANAAYDDAVSVLSPREAAVYSADAIFGAHSVFCGFHASGPCLLSEVERGVRRAWGLDEEGNFSSGYRPLMDNNLMLWVRSLGTLLDAFLRDGVPFYPMVWNASTPSSTSRSLPEQKRLMFSVLASPGGKVLLEIASEDPGGRGIELFNAMPQHARAVLDGLPVDLSVANQPVPGHADDDWERRPIAPLRISRAVGPALLNSTLAFYGVGGGDGGSDTAKANATDLGFGGAKILLDRVDSLTGDRAVTILLSPNATVHLQLWARHDAAEGVDIDGPPFPSDADFTEAQGSNQVNGGQPANASDFCAAGNWTVERYVQYILNTHATVMTSLNATQASQPAAPLDQGDNHVSASDDDDDEGDIFLHPPAGNSMDVFLDDHISWDCTSPTECDIARGGAALYASGAHVQWLGSDEAGWTACKWRRWCN